jgi:hypothetical protein
LRGGPRRVPVPSSGDIRRQPVGPGPSPSRGLRARACIRGIRAGVPQPFSCSTQARHFHGFPRPAFRVAMAVASADPANPPPVSGTALMVWMSPAASSCSHTTRGADVYFGRCFAAVSGSTRARAAAVTTDGTVRRSRGHWPATSSAPSICSLMRPSCSSGSTSRACPRRQPGVRHGEAVLRSSLRQHEKRSVPGEARGRGGVGGSVSR